MTDLLDLYCGDSAEVLATLAENSAEALVCDPPAGIGFMNADWDKDKGGRDAWIAWLAGIMREARRVLKPGGHGLVWAIPRTSHWTALALEQAGFELRDIVCHHFGSGFPKNLNVALAIDKALGVESAQTGVKKAARKFTFDGEDNDGFNDPDRDSFATMAPTSEAAKKWAGYGTALKPATEFWILVRNPIEQLNVAKNVLAHGTGALNIAGCRVGDEVRLNASCKNSGGTVAPVLTAGRETAGRETAGRWPANLVLSHDEQCGAVCVDGCPVRHLGWESRFFYCAKPTPAEKEEGLEGLEGIGCAAGPGGAIAAGKMKVNDGRKTPIYKAYQRGETLRRNIHPTVKSTALMSYLIRLVTPPGGVVLDPFMGSGTTGVSAVRGGFGFIGIEQHEPFFDIATARINHAASCRQGSLFDEVTT